MVTKTIFYCAMSKNNTIKKSDKKFIRTEKARIRRQFLDSKKQKELIDELYKRFVKSEEKTQKNTEVKSQAIATNNQSKPKVEKKENTRKQNVKKTSKIA